MPLTMRPNGLGSGIDKDRPDCTVYCGEWNVGRIYQTRGDPDNLTRFWSLSVDGPMTRSDRLARCRRPRRSLKRVGTRGSRRCLAIPKVDSNPIAAETHATPKIWCHAGSTPFD
jgi:hypothetical protein